MIMISALPAVGANVSVQSAEALASNQDHRFTVGWLKSQDS